MNGMYGYDGQNSQGQMQSGVYASYPGGMVSSAYPNPMQAPAPSQNRNPFAPQQTRYGLRGHYIQNPDEIQAGEVPMDGSVSFFPTNDNSAIIGKMWDKNGKLQQVRYIPDTVVSLCSANMYDVTFDANVTSSEAGSVQLAIAVDGEALPYGTAITTPAATGDINSISKTIPVQGCCRCGTPKVSVVNNGTTPVVLQPNSSLYIRPRC